MTAPHVGVAIRALDCENLFGMQLAHICAMMGKDLVQGIGGFGLTVHDALRDLADEPVKNGI